MQSEVGILVGFFVLAASLGLGKPVWFALLVASLSMGLIGGGLPGLSSILYSTTMSSTAIDLVVVTFLIAVFVNLYRASGFLAKLGEELVKALKKPKAIATLVPAIMGLLPVAGGALMSAPVVDGVGNHLGLSKKLKLFINVWFRHVIFLVYPLSTTLITTASLAGVSMWELVLRQTPIVVSMVAIGYAVSFRNSHKQYNHNTGDPNASLLMYVFSPMLVAIFLAVAVSPLLDRQLIPFVPLTRYSMVLGLGLAIALLVKLAGKSLRDIVEAIISRTTFELVTAAFSAILLRDAFLALGGPDIISGLMPQGDKATELVLLSLTPFVLSLATGSPLTGSVVAISIFKPILSVGPGEASLIYTSNMLGYLASPAHLCYVYSAQYFEQPLTSTYREMLIGVTATLVVAVSLYFLSNGFLWVF
ncbi:MAG: DUF401 family protein [Desulfurococcaceae archaeon]